MANTLDQLNLALWEYYEANGRHDLPWRQPDAYSVFDPYKILLSELMLQQTQVQRVIPKYQDFLTVFPSLDSLSVSELGDVLRLWQGLGYNRRAKFLWLTAQRVQSEFNGIVPRDHSQLVSLPGIGTNTAGAIQAYAYNMPSVFLETNIRTVIIHHCFQGKVAVHDTEILPIMELLVGRSKDKPRQLYWALMDYGTYLKQHVGNLNKLSNTYTKQSTFKGSLRQIRGAVVALLADDAKTLNMLRNELPDERLDSVLESLVSEGLIRLTGKKYHL